MMPLVQATTPAMQRDPCSMLRVSVAKELLDGTIEKVERSQESDKWQVCNASGKNPAARYVRLAVAPPHPTSGSLTAEFCKSYTEARKVAF